MTALDLVTIEAADPTAADRLYSDALALGDRVRTRASDAATDGFRGFTVSLVVAAPDSVDALHAAALGAGATKVKAPKKSLWGYGSTVQAADGTVVTLASSSKKHTGSASRELEELVVQLGVDDVKASRAFYEQRGFTVEKAYGGKYVRLAPGPSGITLALIKRKGLAKAVGVPADGSGSHRVALSCGSGPFTDPDGFVWESSAA